MPPPATVLSQTLTGLLDFDTESIVAKAADTTKSIDIDLKVIAGRLDFVFRNGAIAALGPRKVGGSTDFFDNLECGRSDNRIYKYQRAEHRFPSRYSLCVETKQGNFVAIATDHGCCC